jgi:hypothetical protein
VKRFNNVSGSIALAACLTASVIGAGSAWAEEDPVSGRGYGPGVTTEAASGTTVSGEGPTAVLGESAQQAPISLPRTGGFGDAQLALGLASGLSFAAAGLRLRRRR